MSLRHSVEDKIESKMSTPLTESFHSIERLSVCRLGPTVSPVGSRRGRKGERTKRGSESETQGWSDRCGTG